jgi:succinate dehydrogenase cytochrome b subunit
MRFVDAIQYRLPLAAWVSILHRIAGALMFLLLPFVIWLFDASLSSEFSYANFTRAFSDGLGWAPAWLLRLVTLVLIWAYLHHFVAGLRHLWIDVNHDITKEQGRMTALFTAVASVVLTVVLGAKLYGLY